MGSFAALMSRSTNGQSWSEMPGTTLTWHNLLVGLQTTNLTVKIVLSVIQMGETVYEMEICPAGQGLTSVNFSRGKLSDAQSTR